MDNLDVLMQDLEGVDLTLICDEYCKFPFLCSDQDEMDSVCDNCPFYKLLNLLEALEIVRKVNV